MESVDDFRPGSVALVGAGPGDPELLTRRAAARLAAADVVFYDALVDPDVLDLAGKAQRIYVGKRASQPAIRQTLINQLLVRAARRGAQRGAAQGGRSVPVRARIGGGIALAAGVTFEIVPGVPSPLGATAPRHSGHAPRQRCIVRCRLGSCGGGVRAGAGIARAAFDHRRRAHGAGVGR